MTKTLTEQYYDQTLEDGYYYAKNKTLQTVFILEWYEWDIKQYQDCEIICKVPSYEEYMQLVQKMHILEKRLEVSEKEHYKTLEQLRIATKALEYYDRLENIIIDWKLLTGQDAGTARKAIKEMEGVK